MSARQQSLLQRVTAAVVAVALAARALTAQSVPTLPTPPGASAAYISPAAGPGRFPLSTGGRSAPIVVSDRDYPGVARAARDLAADVERVTGAAATLVVGARPAAARELVLVGTLGRSPLVDSLVARGVIDTAGLAGRWETFVVQPVARPLPGVDQALVVVGSDRRGTVFGAYDLSAQIGVSPWHWWADVRVPRQASLFVLPGRHTEGTPAVRYRGIFINDEAPAFAGWARATFGGVNSRAYARVFELILRLKGNYLWPAMWGHAFAADDSVSPRLADEYGVVMGTSHHEPMTRAHSEWARFGRGAWDYARNDSALRAFWRGGVRRMGARENVVTVGMRGDGDEPMTEGTAIALLERIVADQRRILAEETGRPAAATPQLWALYKEVQDYYDRGMRVPDDVTLLFADDNWGNVRRLPAARDRGRAGGFGVYYHFDYVGGPRNYKWLNTNPVARVWEQMRLAHERGADRIWIVNVGDLKPMEYPIAFFLDYAWNPDRWPAERLPEYARRWAAQQFGPAHAGEVAELVTTTLKYLGRRKPELLDTATYSLAHHREAERVVADWRALEGRAERLRRALPNQYADAYYQLVLHPVRAAATLHDLYATAARNRRYARQGRAATNRLADSARRLFARDAEHSAFYNDTLAGGKWRHMMDQTHVGYTSWQEPPRNVMPRVDEIHVPAAGELGIAWEGQDEPRAPGAGPPRPALLPELDAYRRNTTYLEVYNRGRAPVAYTAAAAEPWVTVSPAAGTVAEEARLTVAVDWARAPAGRHRVPVTVSGAEGRRFIVHVPVPVHNPAAPRRDAVAGFVEGGGVVAVDAEHYTRAVAAPGVRWLAVPDLGRTGSAVTSLPSTAPASRPGGGAPRLEYQTFVFDSGTVEVHAHLSPTLDFAGGTGLRYAVSFDDEPPQVVNVHADGSSSGRTDGNRAWERMVADNVHVVTTRHTLARPGAHTLKFWRVDPGVVLQRLVVDLGGLRPSYLGPPESYNRALAAPTASRTAAAARGAP